MDANEFKKATGFDLPAFFKQDNDAMQTALTVRELIEALSEYDDDYRVVLVVKSDSNERVTDYVRSTHEDDEAVYLSSIDG